ncbi:putative twin-arginine translocation pathway [Mycolicibacterium madagascariense]|uniref:Putative twin-arginine translocation pathway n=1 Tax=Mycolicibacterium madagascariense TaxID=212765 RepID=A0A7I7XG14_9MYCO|nr:putative twin-arginine translocation pathway [Mycolicibacterium madagascariense]
MQDSPGTTDPRPSHPISRRDALRYAAAVSALAGFGVAAAGTPTASAAAPTLIDFAMRQLAAQDIRAAGHSGVINYVSTSRPGSSFGAKPITLPYAQSLTAAGLVIVSNYQYGKPGGTAPSDFTRGYAGGVSDARTAWQLHTAAGGGQSAPIFFSVDDDIDHNTWNTVALQWFRGINSVIGVQRTGIYGGINACQWATADGVIGRSRSPGRVWAWQTRSWSRGQVHPAAVLYQRVVSTESNPGPVVGGLPVDVSDVLAQDCGQWNLHP